MCCRRRRKRGIKKTTSKLLSMVQPGEKDKITLVLDLDHTLIHSSLKPPLPNETDWITIHVSVFTLG